MNWVDTDSRVDIGGDGVDRVRVHGCGMDGDGVSGHGLRKRGGTWVDGGKWGWG